MMSDAKQWVAGSSPAWGTRREIEMGTRNVAIQFAMIIGMFFLFVYGCTLDKTPEEENNAVLRYAHIAYRFYCATDEQRCCFAEVSVKCAEAANPKSDEEPEDWLPRCRDIAREGCCPLTKGVRYNDSNGYEMNWLPWSEVPEEHRRYLEARHRYSK